jgi:hypothetical protein
MLDQLFRSLVPLHNPIGFGPLDFIELAVVAMLAALALTWKPCIAPLGGRLAQRSAWCMLLLAAVPIALRLVLLPHHPVPTPDLYDEFGHLLMADTLRHLRLANAPHPMHRFFETFFVLQQPTYSSIYPIGNGLAMAIGWAFFGVPWAGVLFCTGALCSLSWWMLRGWTTPKWALLGGFIAVFEFGPLNQWTNCYWGGAFAASAGCLVYGALPRLRTLPRFRCGALLGLGLGMHFLSRPYESIFLLLSIPLFLPPPARWVRDRKLLGSLSIAGLVFLPAIGITLLQNKRVTGQWTTLPYELSQYQYGVPAALTFQPKPVPHAPLTPQQELDYRMQLGFRPTPDTPGSYLGRLIFRARYYRFYFLPPLYIALFAFLVTIRSFRWAAVPATALLFALGTNFFPAFQFHYLAGVVCLFLLMSVRGLEQLSRLEKGAEAARVLVFLCIAQFIFWYSVHLFDTRDFAIEARRFDMWDSINHSNPERRIAVAHQIARMPGKLLIFVRYWPQHVFQDEWVYNGADIDGQRVVWARDLGDAEDEKLREYYPGRSALLLESDARPPVLRPYEPALASPSPEPAVQQQQQQKKPPAPSNNPLLEMEQVH